MKIRTLQDVVIAHFVGIILTDFVAYCFFGPGIARSTIFLVCVVITGIEWYVPAFSNQVPILSCLFLSMLSAAGLCHMLLLPISSGISMNILILGEAASTVIFTLSGAVVFLIVDQLAYKWRTRLF